MDNENGRWVTLDNGTHLFIKKGQTVDDAISKLKPSKQENGVKYENGNKSKAFNNDSIVDNSFDNSSDWEENPKQTNWTFKDGRFSQAKEGEDFNLEEEDNKIKEYYKNQGWNVTGINRNGGAGKTPTIDMKQMSLKELLNISKSQSIEEKKNKVFGK